MEGRNRTIWIVIAVVVLLLILCCCVVVVGGAVVGGLSAIPFSREGGFARVEETTEQTFTVGEMPTLEVDNFAGNITIRSGESGQMRATVTKRANNTNRLEQIEVDLIEQDDGLRIETSQPRPMPGYMAVDIEILVPDDTQVDVSDGAGNVRINGVRGGIRAFSGAGNVRVEGATGPVSLETGAGQIDYEGEPEGDCTFQNGAGSITLRLPSDVNANVELTTGVGNIDLGGFDVDGQVSRTEVDGVIGTGEDATIDAHAGAGSITLVQR
jgi:hypothetical protein